MKYFLGLLFLAFSVNAHAGYSIVVIAHASGTAPVNSAINIDADYVAMPVSLSSDAKYPAERAELIRKLQSQIDTAVSKDPNLEFQQGTVSLSPDTKSSSFLASKSYSRGARSSIYILSKLSNGQNAFSAAKEIYSLIDSIKTPEDTNILIGDMSLAITSPNQYRDKLLASIKKEIQATKAALGKGYKASISGLENPVIVLQKDDKQVTVFLNYRVTFKE